MNFIELLVSLLILSCMLLGINSMQMLALRETKAAYYYNMAINQIDWLNERLKNLKNSENLKNLIITWNQHNQEVLPNGRGVISGHPPFYTMTVFWGRQQARESCRENKMGLSGCYTLTNN